MTQPEPTPVQGEDGLGDTELAPSPESEAADEGWQNVIGQAFAEEQAVPPLESTEEEPPADTGTEEVPAGGEATAAAPERLSPEAQVQSWLEQVTANQKSINEIPAKFHPQVMEAYAAQERDVQLRAAKLALEQGLKQGREAALAELKAEQDAAEIAATVRAIDEVVTASETDPTEAQNYLAWRKANPDAAAAYDRYKREGPPDPKQIQAQEQRATEYGQQSQTALMQQLVGFPEADARIRARHIAKPYGHTPAEVGRLAADIAEEKATDLVKQRTPIIAAAEKRAAGVATRSTVPKPDVATGSGGAATAAEGDWKSLIAAGFREDSRR